jgi:hypothetical protein
MAEQPQDCKPADLGVDEMRMLGDLARFGTISPIAQADLERLERLVATGYVAKDPRNPAYSLSVRGWAFVRKPADSEY